MSLLAACTFGLESILSGELGRLGCQEASAANGGVVFSGSEAELARANLWLRTADRLYVRLAEFDARTPEELFAGVEAPAWEEFLPRDARIQAEARTHGSRLASASACQSALKKGIIRALQRRYRQRRFPESGPAFQVSLVLRADRATLLLDSSGEGLHRRGYRSRAGEAPLRETLAAALVLISRWQPPRPLADPLCGAGTIAIEAALIGAGMAPGMGRRFAAEGWPAASRRVWEEAREEARERGAAGRADFRVQASDRDGGAVAMARGNAARAGVERSVELRQQPLQGFRSSQAQGCLISNPPYGHRQGEGREVEELYRGLGRLYRGLDDWSFFLLTAHPRFQQLFGRRATRNRKLYNGNLRVYLYQYYGPLPRREPPQGEAAREG